MRDAIAAFRAKGKFAIAFADSFGEFGAGTRPYYLATAFDQIWLQPMGSLGLTGLYADIHLFQGHARPRRDRARIRPSRPIQDRSQHPHRNQDDPAGARRGRGPARFDLGAGRRRHRAGPQIVAGRGPRRDRPCAAAPRRGVAGQARRPARLSRRRDRRGPQARRLRCRDRRPGDLSRRRRPAEPQGRTDRADLRFGADRPRQRRPTRWRARTKWRRPT